MAPRRMPALCRSSTSVLIRAILCRRVGHLTRRRRTLAPRQQLPGDSLRQSLIVTCWQADTTTRRRPCRLVNTLWRALSDANDAADPGQIHLATSLLI